MGFPEDVCKEAIERYDGDDQAMQTAIAGSFRRIIN